MDLQQLVAAVVKAHHWYFVGNLGVPGMADRKGYKCSCGWATRDTDERGLSDPDDHIAQRITDELIDLAGTGRLLASIDPIFGELKTRKE